MVGEPQIVCHPGKGPLLFLMSPDLLLKYEITITNAGLFRVNGGPPMAGDEVKTLLFAELDTNNLTDTLLTKLNGIETSATADQSDAEIKTAYENNANTNAFTDANVTTLSGAEQSANKGVNSGYAPLDASALVPLVNLPASVKTGSEYKGEYNASTNTPTLVNGTGSNGDYQRVNVAGTQNFGAGNITFSIGDIVVYNGTTTLWQRIAGNPDLVTSVAGKQGVVTIDMDDLSETATGKIFSDVERTKLTGIETNATADQTGAEIKTAYEAELNAYTDTKNTKLAGIETAATADQTDAEIETAYNNQVTVVSQAEAEAGTSTTVRRWTALRVAQAIAALESGGGGGLPFFEHAESLAVSTTTSTTFVQKLRLTTSSLTLGDYKLEWSSEVSIDNEGEIKVQVELNDTTSLAEINYEPIGQESTHYGPFGGFAVLTSISGVQNIDVDFLTENSDKTARVRNVRLAITRVA